jgi:hypothetical protein
VGVENVLIRLLGAFARQMANVDTPLPQGTAPDHGNQQTKAVATLAGVAWPRAIKGKECAEQVNGRRKPRWYNRLSKTGRNSSTGRNAAGRAFLAILA